jgi:hypothetical protein
MLSYHGSVHVSLDHPQYLVDRMLDDFPVMCREEIMDRVALIDPASYARTRNYVDGTVTRLSPYLTHGVVSVREVVDFLLSLHGLALAERLLMELVWKEFFLQVVACWPHSVLYAPVWEDCTRIPKHDFLPPSVIAGNTGTGWVDELIYLLYTRWWLHNHQRMRLASRLVHRWKLGWKACADWTYYHFLDGDLGSNHLSWQWVTGTFSSKPYYMNEENLLRYRPWRHDSTLCGSYEEVADRLFSPSRKSIFAESESHHHLLKTPNHHTRYSTSLALWQAWHDRLKPNAHVRILTPWKLDELLLWDDVPTVVILDTAFTALHPRSASRCAFVQRYCDQYAVPFLLTEYESCVRTLLLEGCTVELDERPDPLYRNTQLAYHHHSSIQRIPYPRTWVRPSSPVLYKFFPYWKIVKDILQDH